jgi:hypothetical protein
MIDVYGKSITVKRCKNDFEDTKPQLKFEGR